MQEFGTNRPTPFTIPDKEEDANKKDTKANSEVDSKTNNEVDGLLTPRIFTDDASEIIERFFFGPLPPGSSAPQTPTSSKKGGKGIPHSASFGSASTMSTMTSAKGRTTRGQQVAAEDNLFTADESELPDNTNEDVIITGWDQDEIDLWKSHDNEIKVEPKEETTVNERVEDDWVSQRRRLLEVQKKRWNWDELGPSVSLSTTETAKKIDTDNLVQRMPSMNIIEAQRILKASQPSQQQNHESTAVQEVQDGDHSKRKGAGAVIVDDGKQHWMPDSLCKQCYCCEAPFTLLRRKHHCRLCGMIFW